MKDEDVCRLRPLGKDLKKLYLYSGNVCALPDCNNNIIDKEGDLIGEVCHIEGAEVNSKRFNSEMTNEDRRAFENLILLCSNCHNKIDGEDSKYTVEYLKKLKSNHEAKYSNVEDILLRSLKDYTENVKIVKPKNIYKDSMLSNKKEHDKTLLNLLKFIEVLKDIPYESRSFLANTLNRQKKGKILPNDVEQALNLTPQQIMDYLKVLSQYISCSIEDDFDNEYNISICTSYEHFDFDIVEYLVYLKDKGISTLKKMIEDLDFSDLEDTTLRK